MATNVTPRGYGNVVVGGLTGGGYATPISITGAGPSNSVLTTTGTGTSWTASNTATMTAKGKLKVEGPEADILINEQSLSAWMQAVNKRLSILQPKPELQEKYSALQEAYNTYKTLEALLYDDQKPNK